ncbi:MAG: GNAT family N-acetyltransferase [Candidatus Omnitrophica bacterium]|nr:GNAT family N-acetyltransferase [Candidatus Omnitrophota bacterium]
MLEFETKRLRLIPLDLEQLKLLNDDSKKFEEKLGLKETDTPPDEKDIQKLKEACRIWITKVSEDEGNYLWYTNWEIVLKEENRRIGGFCFYGMPDVRGEVQIGYMIHPEYQGKGYLTEALRTFVKWAFSQPHVASIKTETPKYDIPLHRILEKVGMRIRGETGETIWWRRVKEDKKL